jgi:hypothetical protein
MTVLGIGDAAILHEADRVIAGLHQFVLTDYL